MLRSVARRGADRLRSGLPAPVAGVVFKPVEVAGDLATLARAGALRPLGLATLRELGRRVRLHGVTTDLVYTIHALEMPDRPALVFQGATTTWAELRERIDRLANHLLSCGIGAEQTIAVMLPNRPEFLETVAAGLKLGTQVAFVNPKSPEADANPLFERTRAKLVVTHRPEAVPDHLQALAVGDPYEGAIASASGAEPPASPEGEGRIVIFTSGTTGRPKGAVRDLSQGASLSSFAGFVRTIPFRRDDVHMVVCPLYHSSGSGFATVAQVLGNTLVLVESFSPEAFCEHVQRHRVTTTAVVPTMLHKLTRWEGVRDYDLSSLRVVVCTGAALRQHVRDATRDLFGDVLYDLYGSTEMAWVSVATPEDQRRKPDAVGRPVPGVRLAILDPEGRPVPTGEVGEIWAGSELAMERYLDDPDLDRERMREGMVSVKDVGFVDADGYLHVVDRSDDMIISGGVNVYPAETEVALSHHPAVAETAVVGIPDEEWGQRIVAAVVRTGDVAPDDLVGWCKDRVSYAAVPKEIRFYDELPRNDVGKVDKRRLAEGWNG